MNATRVAVLGAGPAGSAAAITLARAGAEVTLVDPRPVTGWEPGEGLPAAAGAVLRGLGVPTDGHLRCSGFLSSWGTDEFRPALLDPRGPSWQLDRAAFNNGLREAAGPWRPLRLTECRPGTKWTLRFADAPEISVDFLVDATGRSSAVARMLGVRRRTDSSLVGIAALLDDPDPEDAVSIVEAVPHGWWYVSRVPGDRLVAVLFTDAAIAVRDRLTEPGPWTDVLAATKHAAARVGRPHRSGPGTAAAGPGPRTAAAGSSAPEAATGLDLRTVAAGSTAPEAATGLDLRTVAAGSSALEVAAGPGWVAAGDAACAHEPLAARGLHDALTGGIAAAEALITGTTGDYAARVAAGYRRYLSELAWFYRQETRFPGTDFWAARAAQP
ncbi:NAD(P)/FAD-dependent oxidoreductase [Actinoplanes sp. CA-030573]|uniref:NAD(P)/FAD-dependent oxidoreductase n=1 Tax=Actinoplanes sp. CA-030573 TaxID=3239898 RepID=UPI003D90B986